MIEGINYGKTNLKELHTVLLDILKEFISFCEENNLKYYAYGGTLLGAIRHKGFIPWDDDVDIGMLREDYNRLLDLISRDPYRREGKYQFVNANNDKYFNKGFTRLSNEETTEITIADAAFKYNRGCFIDIIPLDYVPQNTIAKKVYSVKCSIYLHLLRACARYANGLSTKNWKLWKQMGYYLLMPLFRTDIMTTAKLHGKLNNYLTKQKKSELIGNSSIVPGDEKWIFREKWFRNSIKKPFEDIQIAVPESFKKILAKQYGDYLKPIIEAPSHGDTIFDIDTPYKIYMSLHEKELTELFDSIKR